MSNIDYMYCEFKKKLAVKCPTCKTKRFNKLNAPNGVFFYSSKYIFLDYKCSQV